MVRTKAKKINITKNYRLFTRSDDNRPLDMRKHRKLEQSMKKYGFLSCFPIVCHRVGDAKQLVVKDGQHRLALAETLSLPVHWIEEDVDFDIADVNNAARTWGIRDYAMKHAANGLTDYREGLEFCDIHGIPIGNAFALLHGTSSFGNIRDAFVSGEFRVRDREWADAVAGIYGPLCRMCPALKNARLLEACMSVCRVKEFDAKRLLHNAERCREKLVAYSTRDAYLQMLEDIYNFGRAKLVGLRSLATMVMRERSAALKKDE